MTARIAVVGSYGVGLTMRVEKMPGAGETLLAESFDSGHGGKGSNQAVGTARLGVRTTFMTAIGDDSYGNAALALWQEEGVDASHVLVVDDSTMVGFILVEPSGENRIAIAPGALSHLDARAVEGFREAIRTADITVVSMEIPLDAVIATIDIASEVGTPVLLNPAPAQTLPAEALRKVTVITPNQSEARILLGIDADEHVDERELASRIRATTNGTVVLTRGSEGALIADAAGLIEIPAARQSNVIDTTGAGDAFTAALAVALAEGVELRSAAEFASAAGGHAVTQHGVIGGLPTRENLNSATESNEP